MAKHFAEIAFSEPVKAHQQKHGSRKNYERIEQFPAIDGLTHDAVLFISRRDSFYMATMGENGFPYIQHRGGPAGFLRILDANTLGFVDFTGNRQYISVGNVQTNANTCLFLMDYPNRTRLKIFARTEVVELADRPDLLEKLLNDNYRSQPERMMLFHIEAYDWNCPQHITQRFSLPEIESLLAPEREYIKQLEQELKQLKAKYDGN